jgi:hypothetical protein
LVSFQGTVAIASAFNSTLAFEMFFIHLVIILVFNVFHSGCYTSHDLLLSQELQAIFAIPSSPSLDEQRILLSALNRSAIALDQLAAGISNTSSSAPSGSACKALSLLFVNPQSTVLIQSSIDFANTTQENW